MWARPKQQRRVEWCDRDAQRVRAQTGVAHHVGQERAEQQRQHDQHEHGDEQREEGQETEETPHPPILGPSDDQCRNGANEGNHAACRALVSGSRGRVPRRPRPQPGQRVRAPSRAPNEGSRIPPGQGPAAATRARARRSPRRPRGRKPHLRRCQGASLRALRPRGRAREGPRCPPDPGSAVDRACRGHRRDVHRHVASAPRRQARCLRRVSLQDHDR